MSKDMDHNEIKARHARENCGDIGCHSEVFDLPT
jgi:hypothetical protein